MIEKKESKKYFWISGKWFILKKHIVALTVEKKQESEFWFVRFHLTQNIADIKEEFHSQRQAEDFAMKCLKEIKEEK